MTRTLQCWRTASALALALLLLAADAATLRAQTSAEAIDDVLPKVVKIFGAGGLRGLHGYSSGFLVSPEGHIVTVWSHVLDHDTVTVVLDDGRHFEGRVLGAEPPLDMAVLKIEGENLPHFDLSRTVTAGPGSRVLGFSNMFKVAAGDEAVSVLHGVISARTTISARRGTYETPYSGSVYIVDAITNNPGAGGGVLTTTDGKLLGMLGKELRNAQTNTWVNYVIPIEDLKSTIEQIQTGDFSRRPPPELAESANRFQPVDFGIVMIPDVLYRTPAYIDRLLPGSPAAEAGLQPDDLVLFVNDQLIQSCRMLKTELGRLEDGDPLRLVVRRGSRLVTVELTAQK